MTNYEKRIISSYNRFIANIDKQLQGYMRRSNIPAFSNMLKKLTVTTFFYNHDVIKKAVGTKIVLIDNLVYDLLVEALAKSIYSNVNTTDRIDSTKVGWWTNSSIVDIIRRNSAFCPGGDDDHHVSVLPVLGQDQQLYFVQAVAFDLLLRLRNRPAVVCLRDNRIYDHSGPYVRRAVYRRRFRQLPDLCGQCFKAGGPGKISYLYGHH